MSILGYFAMFVICQLMAIWMLGDAVKYLREGRHYAFAIHIVLTCVHITLVVLSIVKVWWMI